ncbi:hypothetical protein K2X30_12010 [bacterium]|jgi:hypothetical protein|nr:hypothetical protein [bacterium]
MSSTPSNADITGEESDIVEMWMHIDKTRWVAGAMAGIFAGLVMMGVAMVFSVVGGMEFWFPVKFVAVPFLGASAMEYGMQMGAIVTGLVFHFLLSIVLGMIYAHFTITNKFWPLMGAGFTWGTFSWIFMNNLFIQAFRDISAIHVSKGAAFFVDLAFGFSLVSVAMFDRMLRGKN